MTRLTVVVPCVDEFDALEGSLAAVLAERPAGTDVLVVHRDDYADPFGLAGDVTFLHRPAASGTLELLAAGLAAAETPLVQLIRPGLVVPAGGIERLSAILADPAVQLVGPTLDVGGRTIAGVGWDAGRGAVLVEAGSDGRAAAPSGTARPVAAGPTLAACLIRRSALGPGGGPASAAGAEVGAGRSETVAALTLALRLRAGSARAVRIVPENWSVAAAGGWDRTMGVTSSGDDAAMTASDRTEFARRHGLAVVTGAADEAAPARPAGWWGRLMGWLRPRSATTAQATASPADEPEATVLPFPGPRASGYAAAVARGSASASSVPSGTTAVGPHTGLESPTAAGGGLTRRERLLLLEQRRRAMLDGADDERRRTA